MNITSKTKFMQDGGAAPAPQGGGGAPQDASQGAAPDQSGAQGGAPGGGQDPMAQILQVAAQAVQNQDCQAAMVVCQALVKIAQGGGGQAQEPTFARRGAKIIRVKK